MEKGLSLGHLPTKIRLLKKDMESCLVSLTKDIEYIIDNKIKDIQKIESHLDSLLNCMELEVGEKEFKRLNKYYATFNKEYSKNYEIFCKELKQRQQD